MCIRDRAGIFLFTHRISRMFIHGDFLGGHLRTNTIVLFCKWLYHISRSTGNYFQFRISLKRFLDSRKNS